MATSADPTLNTVSSPPAAPTPAPALDPSAAKMEQQQPASQPSQSQGQKAPKPAKPAKQQQQQPAKDKAGSADAAPGAEGLSPAELKKKAKAEKAARRAREKTEREGGGASGGQGPGTPAGKKGGADAGGAAAGQGAKGQKGSAPRRGSAPNVPQGESKKKQEDKNVAVFGHLYGQQRRTTVAGAGKEVHPAVLALGLQMRDYVVCGSSARCVATLLAFKRVCFVLLYFTFFRPKITIYASIAGVLLT